MAKGLAVGGGLHVRLCELGFEEGRRRVASVLAIPGSAED